MDYNYNVEIHTVESKLRKCCSSRVCVCIIFLFGCKLGSLTNHYDVKILYYMYYTLCYKNV